MLFYILVSWCDPARTFYSKTLKPVYFWEVVEDLFQLNEHVLR